MPKVTSQKYIFTSGILIALVVVGISLWHTPATSKPPQEITIPPTPVPTPSTTINIFDIVKDNGQLKEVLAEIGVKTAMAKINEESAGGSTIDCHQEAHQVGRVGYTILKEKVFGECDASCHSGCYHGAMESFLNETGTTNLATNIERICTLFDTSFSIFECLHGVGHGILAYFDYDLPAGLKECQKLNGEFAQLSCIGGMFMENVLTAQGLGADKDGHATQWANRTDPHFPCNAIDTDFNVQYQCYQMQTSWMLTMYDYNFDRVRDACLTSPKKFIPVCFKSFGRDASGHTLRNPDEIIKLCAKVPDNTEYQEQCAIGAVNVIVDFWGPGLKHQAAELCQKFTEPFKKACYETLAERLTDVFKTPEERRTRCNEFEKDYQHVCEAVINTSAPLPLAKSKTNEEPQEDASQQVFTTATIILKDDVFLPKEVTIAQGGTVTFVNQSNHATWPASNIHPSHSIYPEFDPLKGIQPGASWSFTFGKIGSWRFHDHLSASVTGVVEVK